MRLAVTMDAVERHFGHLLSRPEISWLNMGGICCAAVLREWKRQFPESNQGGTRVSTRATPIKATSSASVVEEIAEFGTKYDYGLEAGSRKTELIAATGPYCNPNAYLILQQVQRDDEFIDWR